MQRIGGNGDVNVSYTFGTPKNATRQQLPTQLSRLKKKTIISHLVTSSRFSCLECGDLHKNSKYHSWQCIKHTKHSQHLFLYCAWHRPNWSVVDAESAKGERRTRDHRPQTRSGPPTLKKPEYVKEERAPSLLYTLPATGQRKVEALSLSLSEGRKQEGPVWSAAKSNKEGRRWTTVEVDRERGGKEVLSCSTFGLLQGRVC